MIMLLCNKQELEFQIIFDINISGWFFFWWFEKKKPDLKHVELSKFSFASTTTFIWHVHRQAILKAQNKNTEKWYKLETVFPWIISQFDKWDFFFHGKMKRKNRYLCKHMIFTIALIGIGECFRGKNHWLIWTLFCLHMP